MSFFENLILGFVQALLEWLPVSSSGIVSILALNAFGKTASEAFSLSIFFHLGTAISVLVKYWKTYWDAIVKDRSMLRFLIISTAFTGIIGIPLYLLLRSFFVELVGLTLTLIIGILLLVTATLLRMGKINATNKFSMEERKISDEIFLGACQGLAILPGISRSGTTVTFLLMRGFKKEDAFKMSFIISLPAIIGAVAFELLFPNEEAVFMFGFDYIVVLLFVAIIGFLTMEALLRFARKMPFDIICYVLGGITIILVTIFMIVGSA